MHDRIWKRTGTLTLAMTAAAMLLMSAPSFAGTPTLSGNCGATATIVGTDMAGRITFGTSSGICVLNFSGTYTHPPVCTAMNETNGGSAAVAAGVTATRTQMIMAAPWADDDTIAYMCQTY